MASTAPDPIAANDAAPLDTVVDALVRAYRERTVIEAPSQTMPSLTADDARAVAERIRTRRIAAGETPIGYKVGFTNGVVRAAYDAAGPMQATMYDTTLLAGTTVDTRGLIAPRIEPEIVVGIGVDGEPVWAALGFEIVQRHIADWAGTYVDAIADYGLHAALVVGARRPVDAAGLRALDGVRIELHRNGEAAETGGVADVDGGPLGSLDFLRADLMRLGRALRVGDIVTTGSMTRVPSIAPGERWTVNAGDALATLNVDVV